MLYTLAASMKPLAVRASDSFTSPALRDIQDTFSCLPRTGLSHQQVAVRQRHPPLQTDGGKVRIWQPVGPLTPRLKKKKQKGEKEGAHEAEDNLSAADRG